MGYHSIALEEGSGAPAPPRPRVTTFSPVARRTLFPHPCLLPNSAQLSVVLSLLNTAYKVLVVYTAIALTMAFSKRDALIQQMELDAGLGCSSVGNATTSSGEPTDSRSLAAQAGR